MCAVHCLTEEIVNWHTYQRTYTYIYIRNSWISSNRSNTHGHTILLFFSNYTAKKVWVLSVHTEVTGVTLTWRDTCPLSRLISPRTADRSDDLPAPTGPTTATSCPSLTSRDKLPNEPETVIHLMTLLLTACHWQSWHCHCSCCHEAVWGIAI